MRRSLIAYLLQLTCSTKDGTSSIFSISSVCMKHVKAGRLVSLVPTRLRRPSSLVGARGTIRSFLKTSETLEIHMRPRHVNMTVMLTIHGASLRPFYTIRSKTLNILPNYESHLRQPDCSRKKLQS